MTSFKLVLKKEIASPKAPLHPAPRHLYTQGNDQTGVAPLNENGDLYSDSTDKANILNRHFSSVFSKDDRHAGTTLQGPSYPPIRWLRVENQGVQKLLSEINPSKTGRSYQMSCRIQEELAESKHRCWSWSTCVLTITKHRYTPYFMVACRRGTTFQEGR